MSTYRYYRVTNPEGDIKLHGDGTDDMGTSRCVQITASEFAAAVGDTLPAGSANVAAPPESPADAMRALEQQSRRLQFGAVTVWRLNEHTGDAEGWRVDSPAAG
jgi:hypothetical protein